MKAYCVGENLNFDAEAYDAFVADIVNQNLKDETGRIKNICGVTGSVNAERFKVALSGYINKDMHVFEELRECIFDRN